MGSRDGLVVKNLPAMQETPVRFLGWEDLLEKGKATHSQYSGLENSMDYIYSPWDHKEADTTERLSRSFIYGVGLPRGFRW